MPIYSSLFMTNFITFSDQNPFTCIKRDCPRQASLALFVSLLWILSGGRSRLLSCQPIVSRTLSCKLTQTPSGGPSPLGDLKVVALCHYQPSLSAVSSYVFALLPLILAKPHLDQPHHHPLFSSTRVLKPQIHIYPPWLFVSLFLVTTQPSKI